MVIRPFRALRPDPDAAAMVAAVPYDVVTRDEARRLANRESFLRVSRAEIELPTGTDPYSAEVYEKARSNLAEITREAPLIREKVPSLYVYRLTLGDHSQTGIVGTFSVDEYDAGSIKKHERTRKDKEDDRTRHILTLSAQTGPVFLAYRDVPDLDREVAQVITGEPLYDFVRGDVREESVRHEVWRITEPAAIEKLFASKISALYIADGHHRAAAASRAHSELKRKGGTSESGFFLAVAFPASQLKILPYYRVVQDLAGHSREEFLAAVGKKFSVSKSSSLLEPAKGEFGLCLRDLGGASWYHLKPLAPWKGLDVDLLQETVLGPLLEIADPRTDQRIDFVGGIRGTQELERRVREGAAAAFSLHPTRIEEVMEVSDSGGIMPPKSTWFEPKLRDGLFSHLL